MIEEDKHIPEDERTMKLLAEVANTIFKCVQFTVDFPSKHEDGMVPVLDLKVVVRENRLVHEFYEKPCAAKMIIPSNSAHSRKMKMAVLVKEGIRRLRNNSQGRTVRLSWKSGVKS